MSLENDEALSLNFRSEEEIEDVDPDELKPDPNQPRQTWTEEVLNDIKKMAETFLVQGVIEPVEVDENNIIIRGERRWRAAIIVKHEKGVESFRLPIKRKMGLSPKEKFERQLTDDAHRKDMNPIDRAWAYTSAIVNINTGEYHTINELKGMDKSNLLILLGLSQGGSGYLSGQSELSRRTGIPQPTISHYLKLIHLPESLQRQVNDGVISLSTGAFLADSCYDKLWDIISLWISLQEDRVTENQVREMLNIFDPIGADIRLTDYPDKLDLLMLRAGKSRKTLEEWKKSVNELIEEIKREREESQRRQIENAFKALDEPPKDSNSTPEPLSETDKLLKELVNQRVPIEEARKIIEERIKDEPPVQPSQIQTSKPTTYLTSTTAALIHCPKCGAGIDLTKLPEFLEKTRSRKN